MADFPYNLPIWRCSHIATSADGRHVAEISRTFEISMGNPTHGTLKLSDGLELAYCNPSFLWSDDSRYLAVPQFAGFFRRQRMLIIDVAERAVFASRERAWYFQPESFAAGRLVALKEPNRKSPKQIRWDIPKDLRRFKEIGVSWPLSVGVSSSV